MKIELAPGVIAIVNDGDRENEGKVVTLMFLCPPDSGFNVNTHSLVNCANYPIWVCEGDVSVVIDGIHGAKSNGWGAFKPEHLIPIGEGNPPTPQKVNKSKPGCVVLGAADDEEYSGKMAILEQIVKPGVRLVAEQSTLISHTTANITIQ